MTARLPLRADTLGTRLEAMLEKHAAEFDYQLKLRVFKMCIRDRSMAWFSRAT